MIAEVVRFVAPSAPPLPGLAPIRPFAPRGAAYLANGVITAALIGVGSYLMIGVLDELLRALAAGLGLRLREETRFEIAASLGVLIAAGVALLQGRRLAPENPGALIPFGPLRVDRMLIVFALLLLLGDTLVNGLIDRLAPPGFQPPVAFQPAQSAIVWSAFATVIAFPVAEEILFRGLLHTVVERTLGVAAAIILPTLAFVLVHAESGPGYLLAILPGSFLLAFARQLTGGITAPIVLHMIGNAAAEIGTFLGGG
jgi:membrane protease YdiL (CAAX protease family)